MAVVLSLVQWWGLEVVVLKGGCAFGLLEIGADARASHLLYWAVFCRFEFSLLLRSLGLRTRLIGRLSF